MKPLLSFLFCVLFVSGILPGSKALATNSTPIFINGAIQAFTVCENASATSINAQLSVLDSDAGQTEIWSVVVNAAHGTLVVGDTAVSTGDTLIPSGLTYMPVAGFSGTDSFVVKITDGIDSSATTIYVTVSALPFAGIITGTSNICLESSHEFADTVAGGVWATTNSSTSISSTGSVTGNAMGTDTVLYTVTNGCGSATDTFVLHVIGTPVAGPISGVDSLCSATTDTLIGAMPGGTWHSSNFITAIVNESGVITAIAPGTTTISYIVTNECGSDTARHTVKVQIPVPAGSIIGVNSLCQFNTTILFALVPNGTWTSSNYFVASVLDGLVIGILPGTATITYTLDNTCGTSSATQDMTVLSTAECAMGVSAIANQKPAGAYIYPIPNDGNFTFTLFSDKNEPVTVTITNITGIKIKEFTTVANKDEHIQLNQPAGVYFLNSKTASGNTINKFMIQ